MRYIHFSSIFVSLPSSVFGAVAVVRLAFSDSDRHAAEVEVAAYQALAPLQGVSIPRLLATGSAQEDSVYFVATEFVKVACASFNPSEYAFVFPRGCFSTTLWR